ncbi:hypothetical protein I3760_01G102600 [Carya illinoinensis]|uniref:Protein kinase domain-containing protein n=1 Tax=Carya illinoinensis TaxID=32201 RepID=A0A922DBN1_CARIL|nr:hypothetical protein I3760_01G102600 [Carya illinoinensis]KAG6682091.1 hypothetical protein I3842_13G120700 [Carya illinoinensis]
MGFLVWLFYVLLSVAPSLRGCMGDGYGVPIRLNDDVLGLIVFKSDLRDPSSHLSSWNEDDDSPCSWKYIQCNPVSGRVSEISLDGLGLTGRIGRGLEKLRHLKVLSLSRNNFSGSISPQLALTSALVSLNLSRNSLSGRIPVSLVNMSTIRVLDLSENSFSGAVPDNLFQNCLSLRQLSLAGNMLEGSIPSTLPRCSLLNSLNLSKNRFSGTLDFTSGIWTLKRLRVLDLSKNALSGPVPNGIAAIHYLKEFLLSGNHFSGPLPVDTGLCPHLYRLDFGDNRFTGALPDSLQRLNSLIFFRVSNNMLTGDFPSWIGNMSSLEYLDFSRNSLAGNLPSSMGELKSLKYLSLSHNKLGGNIPMSLVYCTGLSVIHLGGNSFDGRIPESFFDLGLEEIDFSGNKLMGSIPRGSSRIYESLHKLDMSRNNLTGSIPAEMGLFSNLRYLNLSWNNLKSRIPQELGRLQNLLAVNISYNRLEGRLPVGGIFPNLDQSSLQGNLGICSPVLKGPCKLNVPKPLVLNPNAFDNPMGDHKQRNRSSKSKEIGRHNFLSVSAIVAISAAILITFGVIVIALLNVSARRRLIFVDNALESLCSSSSRSGSAPTGKLVLFDSRSSPDLIGNPEPLLNKASEIGGGMFGTVYKVPLGTQGRMVAIKKLVTSNIIRYPEDFDREVRVLGKAEHPNLIKLKGYYWAPQTQLLVSEFAPNGSLQSKLHERLPSVPPLSWAERFKILLGTAKGLAHLHHSFRPPIIHYNIKPSNILLDENHNPKISDFGLARLLTELEKHIISNRFQSALGYVAPELACQSLRVNEKCDIYGFGVMILEVVTGKRPVEYGEDNVVILSDHMRFSLEQGNALDCVDPSMSEYPEDEVLPVLKLALVCTSQIPSSRPSMEEVVHILQLIKTPAPQRTGLYY